MSWSDSLFFKGRFDIQLHFHCKYFLCLGFLIRVIWRISAVSNRFLIISLIWTVLGGAFEIILLVSMIIIWYLLIGCYTCCHRHKYQKLIERKINSMHKEHVQDGNFNDHGTDDTGDTDDAIGSFEKIPNIIHN